MGSNNVLKTKYDELRNRLLSTRPARHAVASNYVKYGKLALNEMRKLDEAGGAPINFETRQLHGFRKRSLGDVLTAPVRLAGWLFKKIPDLTALATLPLRAMRGIGRGMAHAGRFIFSEKYRRQMQTAARKQNSDADLAEKKAIDALRPRDAFRLALDRLHEYQVQAFVLVAAPAMATNLGTVGYYAQNNSLDVVNAATFPIYAIFNAAMIGTAAYMALTRFNLGRLEAQFAREGESGLESHLVETEKKHQGQSADPASRKAQEHSQPQQHRPPIDIMKSEQIIINDKPYPRPSAAFASLARRLLWNKNEIFENKLCSTTEALKEARAGMIWDFRMDAIAKGSILGLGAGGLMFSGIGPVAVFGGLAMAALGCWSVRGSLNHASMVDTACTYYNQMSPGQFTQYLNSARQPN